MLRALAVLPAAGLLAGGCSTGRSAPRTSAAADLIAEPTFLIAHRGGRDEAPEHTMEAYTRIVGRGAAAVELSVHRTADGVLVCHHDPTLQRTCGDPAAIKDLTFAELATRRIDLRRTLGPAWGTQSIPRLTDVLDAIGGKAVLFVEPKAGAAASAVLSMVADRKLQGSTVYKQYFTARGEQAARDAGLLVWNYFDEAASAADIAALGPRSDMIGAVADKDPIADAQVAGVRAAVATGKPVIAWALHRRHQAADLAAAGVRGFMDSSWSYLSADRPTATRDAFGTGRVQPGDLPAKVDDTGSPRWNDDGSVSLADSVRTQSLMMGSLCPTPQEYDLSMAMRFDGLPPPPGQGAGIVLGRTVDAPYAYGEAAAGDGVLAILERDGSLDLRDVAAGGTAAAVLGSAAGPAVVPGRWEQLAIRVRAGSLTVIRAGVPAMTVPVPSRGRYFGLTRTYAVRGAAVRYRDVVLTAPLR